MTSTRRRRRAPPSATGSFFISTISLAALLPSALAQNPPWEVQTFDFGWSPYNSTLTQCRVLDLVWSTRSGASPTPQPPFEAVVWAAGQQPYNINVGQGVGAGGGYEYGWLVNLPVGGPYMISLYDSQGGTGGTANVFNILTANPASCSPTAFTSASLQFNLGSVTSQCGVIPMTVTGGTPPYNLKILPENYPPKAVSYSTGEFNYTLDVKSGVNVFFAVEDSTGKGAVATMFNVQSGSTSCQNLAATLAPGSPALTSIYPGEGSTTAASSGTNTASAGGSSGTGTGTPLPTEKKKSNVGAIAGGAAAGAVVLILAGIWLLTRGRRNKQNPPAPGFTANHDIDQPHIAPYMGGAAAAPLMANNYHPGGSPATYQQGMLAPVGMPVPNSPRTSSWQSSDDTNSSALLMGRRGDTKGDPTRPPSGYTPQPGMVAYNPTTPNTSPRPDSGLYGPSSAASASNRYSDTQLSSSAGGGGSADPYWGQNHPSMAASRTTSPGLPPGAALPNPLVGALGRSDTTATALDRLKTPPPQYSERPFH